jgi:hypothetical protein
LSNTRQDVHDNHINDENKHQNFPGEVEESDKNYNIQYIWFSVLGSNPTPRFSKVEVTTAKLRRWVLCSESRL